MYQWEANRNPWAVYRMSPSQTPTYPKRRGCKSATSDWAHHVGSSSCLIAIVVMTLFHVDSACRVFSCGFVADFGGYLGLLIGGSVMTLIEVIDLLFYNTLLRIAGRRWSMIFSYVQIEYSSSRFILDWVFGSVYSFALNVWFVGNFERLFLIMNYV